MRTLTTDTRFRPRRNRVVDPIPQSGNPAHVAADAGWRSRWFGSAPNAGTYTVVTGPTPTGVTPYMHKQWTAIGAGIQDIGWGFMQYYPITPAQAGWKITSSLWWRRSWTDTGTRNRFAVTYFDASQAALRTVSGTNAPVQNPMEWQRLSETFIVPADLPTMASLQLIHDYYAVGPNVVGDYLDYCSPTIDINGPTDTRVAGGVPPYFDGTLPHCKWEGTANASISASNGWANQESLESIAGVPDVNGVAWSQTTVLSTSSPDGLAVWYHPGTHAAARWCYAGYNGVRTVIGTGNGVQIVGVNGTTLTPSQTFNTSAPIDRSFVTATRLRGGTSADLITRLPSFQYLTSAVSPAATFVVNQADVIPGGLVWAWAKPVSDTQVQRILNWIGRRYAVA